MEITREMMDADIVRRSGGDPGIARVLAMARYLGKERARTGLTFEQIVNRDTKAAQNAAYESPRCCARVARGRQCLRREGVPELGMCFQHARRVYAGRV